MKWAAVANHIPANVVNTQSLRAGGSASLFWGGVNWISISEMGQTAQFYFSRICVGESIWFTHFGETVAQTHGLTKLAVDGAPLRQRTRFGPNMSPRTGGFRAQKCARGAGPLNRWWRISCLPTKVTLSESSLTTLRIGRWGILCYAKRCVLLAPNWVERI